MSRARGLFSLRCRTCGLSVRYCHVCQMGIFHRGLPDGSRSYAARWAAVFAHVPGRAVSWPRLAGFGAMGADAASCIEAHGGCDVPGAGARCLGNADACAESRRQRDGELGLVQSCSRRQGWRERSSSGASMVAPSSSLLTCDAAMSVREERPTCPTCLVPHGRGGKTASSSCLPS